MMNWTNVLSNQKQRTAIKKFATGSLSGTELQKTFRTVKDKEVSKEVCGFVRKRDVQDARKVARKALRRRNLIK